MIHIHYTKDDGWHELAIEGHANYSDCGRDIVCAGVSAIAYTLIGFLENKEEDVEDMGGSIVDSGEFYLSCKGSKVVDLAYEMAVVGLWQIANTYPDNVSISISAHGGDSRE